MSKPAGKTKPCSNCGRPFTFTRNSARYCSSCSSPAARTRRYRIRRLASETRAPLRDTTFRPSNLRLAGMALERGVPLASLILSEHERAVLVAGSPLFPIELRLEAAKGLTARHYRTFRLEELLSEGKHDEEMNIAFAVMESVEATHQPTDALGTASGKGRPRKVPWTPAEWPWELLLHDFLPRDLGKRLRAHKADPNRTAARLDEPLEVERWGTGSRQITLADSIAAGDDSLEPEDRRRRDVKRRATLRNSGLRWPKGSLGMTRELPEEWGYERHPLELHLASGRLTNPEVPFTILEEMRLEISRGTSPLHGYDIEEQPHRAHEQTARHEARERRDREMTSTVLGAVSDLRAEVRDGFARLEQKLGSQQGVGELEAYLQGVTDGRQDYVHEPGEPPRLVSA